MSCDMDTHARMQLLVVLFCPAQVKIYFALMHLHPLDLRITYRSTPGVDVQVSLGQFVQMVVGSMP